MVKKNDRVHPDARLVQDFRSFLFDLKRRLRAIVVLIDQAATKLDK